jgi:hypothetical protein
MTNQEFIESISLPNEEWRDVVGFEGRYAVSSFGRVITFGFHNCGRVPKKNFSPKILKTDLARGYLRLCLYKNNKQYKKVVHRLVAEAFIPNPNNYPTVDHIDRNRQNNKVTNLRWCTLSDNMKNPLTIEHLRKINIGRSLPQNYRPVVSVDKKGDIKKYESIKSCVAEGFKSSAISDVCAGRSRTHKGLRWMYLEDYETLNQ